MDCQDHRVTLVQQENQELPASLESWVPRVTEERVDLRVARDCRDLVERMDWLEYPELLDPQDLPVWTDPLERRALGVTLVCQEDQDFLELVEQQEKLAQQDLQELREKGDLVVNKVSQEKEVREVLQDLEVKGVNLDPQEVPENGDPVACQDHQDLQELREKGVCLESVVCPDLMDPLDLVVLRDLKVLMARMGKLDLRVTKDDQELLDCLDLGVCQVDLVMTENQEH